MIQRKAAAGEAAYLASMTISVHFAEALDRAAVETAPYRHWLLDGALPEDTCATLAGLPIAPTVFGDTAGRRETHNALRVHATPTTFATYPVLGNIAEMLQEGPAIEAIQRVCGVDLAGTSLRIEYCRDTEGFWLEPHTDIGVKRFTMLIYLSDGPGSEAWGTDVLEGPDRFVRSAPYRRNGGLIFIPATNTWHGFRRRPIDGVRKSLMVNYVGPEWRSRHELAFPDRPVGRPS